MADPPSERKFRPGWAGATAARMPGSRVWQLGHANSEGRKVLTFNLQSGATRLVYARALRPRASAQRSDEACLSSRPHAMRNGYQWATIWKMIWRRAWSALPGRADGPDAHHYDFARTDRPMSPGSCTARRRAFPAPGFPLPYLWALEIGPSAQRSGLRRNTSTRAPRRKVRSAHAPAGNVHTTKNHPTTDYMKGMRLRFASPRSASSWPRGAPRSGWWRPSSRELQNGTHRRQFIDLRRRGKKNLQDGRAPEILYRDVFYFRASSVV